MQRFDTPARRWLAGSFGVLLLASVIGAVVRIDHSALAVAEGFVIDCIVFALLVSLKWKIWVGVLALSILGELLLLRAAQIDGWETWRVVVSLLGSVFIALMVAPAVRRELR